MFLKKLLFLQSALLCIQGSDRFVSGYGPFALLHGNWGKLWTNGLRLNMNKRIQKKSKFWHSWELLQRSAATAISDLSLFNSSAFLRHWFNNSIAQAGASSDADEDRQLRWLCSLLSHEWLDRLRGECLFPSRGRYVNQEFYYMFLAVVLPGKRFRTTALYPFP